MLTRDLLLLTVTLVNDRPVRSPLIGLLYQPRKLDEYGAFMN
jgi:hypothetical protein